MNYLKILTIVARLTLSAEADGYTCHGKAVVYPPWAIVGAQVDCTRPGRFRTYLVLPTGLVSVSSGRKV